MKTDCTLLKKNGHIRAICPAPRYKSTASRPFGNRSPDLHRTFKPAQFQLTIPLCTRRIVVMRPIFLLLCLVFVAVRLREIGSCILWRHLSYNGPEQCLKFPLDPMKDKGTIDASIFSLDISKRVGKGDRLHFEQRRLASPIENYYWKSKRRKIMKMKHSNIT